MKRGWAVVSVGPLLLACHTSATSPPLDDPPQHTNPTTPSASAPNEGSGSAELEREPVDPAALPLGAEQALPVLHRARISTVATLTNETTTVVVYSFNRFEEFIGTRAPELRATVEAAIAELQAECEADRASSERDDADHDPTSTASCSVSAAADATGLSDGDIECEVLALASFDETGVLQAQVTLAEQGCRDGPVLAELRDLSGHGSTELVVLSDLTRYGPSASGFGPLERRQRLSAYHLEFRKEPFVQFLEVDLLERGPDDAAPPLAQRRIRTSPRWLEVFSRTPHGGCDPDEDDEDGPTEEHEEDDACQPLTAERLRWDHFEGRYVESKPMVMDTSGIERNLERLPVWPPCTGPCDDAPNEENDSP